MPNEAQLLEANDLFYQFLRAGDLAAMSDLWARNRLISCTHPGRSMLIGREAVMESWRLILTQNPPSVWPAAPRPVMTGTTAFVLTIERIDGSELMASNGFVVEDGHWRMINHQASYMPAAQAR